MKLALGLKSLRQTQVSAFAYAAYTLALDFKNGVYGVGGVKQASLSAVPGYSYTRSGAKSELNGTASPAAFAANVPGIVPGIGYWSRNALTNIILNAGSSTDLATQSVTVTAQAYTIAFMGTGTITLSGAATGTLTGTGAANRVALVFTPTAGTLTVTVSGGTCAYSGLIAGNFPDGGPIIPTTAAAASIGADALTMTPTAPVDQDALFLFSGNWPNVTPTGLEMNYLWIVGGNTYLQVYRNTGSQVLHIESSTSGVGTPFTSAAAVTGVGVAVLSRQSGQWRAGFVQSGAITWFGAAVTSSFPTGMTTLYIGNNGSGSAANLPIGGMYYRAGTFSTDASIIAAAQAVG